MNKPNKKNTKIIKNNGENLFQQILEQKLKEKNCFDK